MIILFDYEMYRSMFNLGIETWKPRHKTWKRFEISFLIGPLKMSIIIGNRAEYRKQKELMK